MLSAFDKRRGAERIVTVLDIGSSKVCCMIAALAPWAGSNHAIGKPLKARLLAVATKQARGIKSGVIVDMNDAEEAVRAVIGRAEQMAGVTVEDVVVSVSCGRLRSTNFTARRRLPGERVTDGDIDHLLQTARRFAEKDERVALHLGALSYQVDGTPGIVDPRGRPASELAAEVHVVTAEGSPLDAIVGLLDRCHLDIEGLVPTPYASALAVLSAEEARLGVACIDMGGGTTTLSIFAEGQFVYTDAVALGGHHVTYDIARQLSAPLAEAERIKTLYGTIIGAASDAHEVISYPLVGQDEDAGLHQVTRADIREIIQGRVHETLELVARRLEGSGFAEFAGDRIVLTGGASQLTGVGAYAAQVFARPVRIGRPQPFAGLPENVRAPGFSTVVGLLHARAMPRGIGVAGEGQGTRTPRGYLGRVGQWFKESFWDEEPSLARGA
ncbi:MAG: cell division protein FtsA [Rhizobiales bacterium]|nr:cell division protein FtsA [Hyphomicrobiales bacterium]